MPDLIPAWLSNILGKEPTVKIMMTIFFFLVLVTFVPQDLFANHPMPSLAFYPGMFALGFLVSHFIFFILGGAKSILGLKLAEINETSNEKNRVKSIDALFNSFSKKEVEIIAMAIDFGKHYITLKRGDPIAISLMKKGLISHRTSSLTGMGNEDFYIKNEYYDECYVRYSGYYDH